MTHEKLTAEQVCQSTRAPCEWMEQIVEGLADPACRWEEIHGLLHGLEQLLIRRFREEEEGQHMEAILYSPWLTPEVQFLNEQHAELLRSLQSLIRKVEKPQHAPADRQQIRLEFDEFAAYYLEHEAGEEAVLHDVYPDPEWPA